MGKGVMMEASVTTSSTPDEQPTAPTLVVAPGDPKPEAEQDDSFVLRINGKEYDATDLTWNEAEEIEDLCGGTSLAILDLARPKTMKAIIYVMLKRDNPNITLEEAGQLKMRDTLGDDSE